MDLLRKKRVEDLLSQGADEGTGLRKRLGAVDLTGLGVGVVIGTGIFTLTGVEAKNHAGPAVVISFLIAGVVSLLAALCYAELASGVPTAGSAYSYAYVSIGELVAWIIGWDIVLEFALGAAVVARGWSGYLQNLFSLPTSIFGEDATVNVGAMAITVVLGVIAALGIRESARVTNALVVVKVAVCLFIIVAGAFFVKLSNWSPFVPGSAGPATSPKGAERTVAQAVFGLPPEAFGIGGILTAAAVVFFAYSGFEAVANMSEETRKPSRDLPLGLFGTLAIATALYIGVSAVVTGMVSYGELSEGSPLASAFDAVGASWAGTLISIAAVCGLTSVILVCIITMGRIGFAMARDGLLPKSVAAIHPRFGTPVRITAVVTVLVAALSGFVPLEALANLVSIGTLFAFLIVSAAIPILRRSEAGINRPFRVPWSPFIPILSVLACLYLMLNLTIATWLRFAVWLALGLVIYLGYGYRHARLSPNTRSADPEQAGLAAGRTHE
ncbi:MAG TPA: amino acid permease [Jatrophihabitans sp.]|jgi:APA family basic amino acid/polyamine antiporter|uniref:amino acid permease n=1 Tax=Jatrophihabitans sp. TaxID=1932789 RepID=UPI002F010803